MTRREKVTEKGKDGKNMIHEGFHGVGLGMSKQYKVKYFLTEK